MWTCSKGKKRVAFCRIIAIINVTLRKIKVRHLPDMKNTDLDNKSTESVFFCCLKYANEKVCKNKRNEEAAIGYSYETEAIIELLKE